MKKLKSFWAKTRKFLSYVGAVFTLLFLFSALIIWRLILVPFVWVEVGTLPDVIKRFKIERQYQKAKREVLNGK
ncbi:MAG: hypothetical protein KDC56_01575 [Flavobacteriaceae bacterium]|nr:hypothetical protein [Flavobacteriaceae bacterium]